jgi:hypothetical protein
MPPRARGAQNSPLVHLSALKILVLRVLQKEAEQASRRRIMAEERHDAKARAARFDALNLSSLNDRYMLRVAP